MKYRPTENKKYWEFAYMVTSARYAGRPVTILYPADCAPTLARSYIPVGSAEDCREILDSVITHKGA
jgi:hypothetical protein